MLDTINKISVDSTGQETLCITNMNLINLGQATFTLCSNVFKLGSIVLSYFLLTLDEGENDDNEEENMPPRCASFVQFLAK